MMASENVLRHPLALCALTALLIAGSGGHSVAAEKVQPFTATTLDGQSFTLEENLGKTPILIDFGSIYCSSCVTLIPQVITIQNRYGVDKLRVIGVNLDTYGVSRVRRFYGQFRKDLNYPIVIDRDLRISRAFGVNTLPTYIVVDREGSVAYTFVGFDEDTSQRIGDAVRKVVEEGETAAEVSQVVEDVVLLSPDSFTKTFNDSISIVGLTGGRTGPFSMLLNGGSEKKADYHGKMFWVRTPLSLGSNYIEVRYSNRGKQATQAVVMFREPVMGEGLQVSFPEFQFHTPDRESRCTPCHELTAEGAGEMAMMTTFCLRCHEYLGGQPYVHGPITVGGCSPCHDFTSKPHKYDLLTQGSDLCFSCHEDIRDKFAKDYVHGPVAMGFCTVCHSPHSSSFKYQIRLPEGDLCLSCHENMKEKAAQFVQHRPFRDGRCSGCHDPHASDNASAFLKGDGEGLCRLCHDEEGMAGHKHPVGRPPKLAVAGMKLDRQGNLTCRSCHDPHASDSDRMSPVPGGCGGCHEM
jgi:predicted CXXCH cytochrome family protein